MPRRRALGRDVGPRQIAVASLDRARELLTLPRIAVEDEQASTLVTSNLPFNEWTEIFGSERLTGALLDRLTHHVHILELNGDSYRLEHSKKARQHPAAPTS